MKKTILVLTIIVFLSLFAQPIQVQAAWYNQLGSKIKSIFVKEKTENTSPTNTPEMTSPQKQEKQSNVAPSLMPDKPKSQPPQESTNPSGAKITEMEGKIEWLTTNLNNLYTAHAGLVADHNKLLKYTSDEISDLTNRYNSLLEAHNSLVEKHNNLLNIVNKLPATQGVSGASSSDVSNLEIRVSSLEDVTKKICNNVFSSLFLHDCKGLSNFAVTSLESRIENLEKKLGVK